MRDDVIKTISSAKNISHAIILTHNIDFVFVQTMVLTAFGRCGHPTITIFADAACASESFIHQSPVLAGLGVRYRVVPVSMNPGFRFHPKAVLLSGEDSGTLLVGSGNLTFGGWRENAEIWLRFDSERDGTTPFHTFQGYLSEIIGRVALPDTIYAEVDEAFDAKRKPWLSQRSVAATQLIGRIGSGAPLLEQMVDNTGTAPIEELMICSPYFDEEGLALQQAITRVNAQKTTVLCQPERTTLTQRAWKLNSSFASIQRIDFKRIGASGEEKSVFIHAKFYASRRDKDVIIFTGSANCSRAALTQTGSSGNAELLAIQSLSHDEFEEKYLNELTFNPGGVVLYDDLPLKSSDTGFIDADFRILAARYEAPSLLVAYSPPSANISECLLDSEPVQFTYIERGVIRALCDVDPKIVIIQAQINGERRVSAPAWIDYETSLRHTARGRSMADSIRVRVQPGSWNAKGWSDLLTIFCKHLSYMPTQHIGGVSSPDKINNTEISREVTFTATDVFSSSYRVPSLSIDKIPSSFGGSGHIQSIQQLLLRWFGIATEGLKNDETDDKDNIEHDDESTQDRPEPLRPSAPSSTELAEHDKKRILTLLSQLETAMTSTDFLEKRSPDYLAADLKIASALLRIGLREGWVEQSRLFDLTHKIWSSLFFSSGPRMDMGWLEYRTRTSEDMSAFVKAMQSAELSAALIAWKLAVPSTICNTPDAARFTLAAVLAVARVPWIWHGSDPEIIATEIKELLAITTNTKDNIQDLIRQYEFEWGILLKRGHALRLLEAAVKNLTPNEIRDRITSDELNPGDILWQGKAGFCVVRQRASRLATNCKVKVLKLQHNGSESDFSAHFTIPIKALLSEDVLPITKDFDNEPRSILREFIDDLSRAFYQHG